MPNPHAKDAAGKGSSVTRCGDCLKPFPAATSQQSANLAKAHVEAGCPSIAKPVWSGSAVTDAREIRVNMSPPPFMPDEPELRPARLTRAQIDAHLENIRRIVGAPEKP